MKQFIINLKCSLREILRDAACAAPQDEREEDRAAKIKPLVLRRPIGSSRSTGAALALSAVLVLLPAMHADNERDEEVLQRNETPTRKHRSMDREQRFMSKHWREQEQKQELRHAEMGKFADLYRQPARPVYATYTKQDIVVGVAVKYSDATKAFGNNGVSVDVAKADFTDGDIRVRDLLFASELVNQDVATHRNDNVINNVGAVVTLPGHAAIAAGRGAYLGYLGDKKLLFKGERQRLEAGINAIHYFFDHRLGLGVFVPVVQDKRKLDVTFDWSVEDVTRKSGVVADQQAPFQIRYGDDPRAFLADVIKAKGMNGGIGGTSVGVGDVQLYAQAQIDVSHLDRALIAARVVCPSAPQASTNNLWGPERGNGGFFQTGLSFSAVSHYNKNINPHFFVESVYSLPATNNQRVPKKVSIPAGASTSLDLGKLTPLGYRLDARAGGAAPFTAFNSPFRNLGDDVSKLKTAKGLAFDVRVGNLFEQVFVRRAELDLFYNFKIKGRDRVYNLPESDYNLLVYEQDSDQIEHRLGGEWRWQVNHAATVRLGLEQVLWGKNVVQDTQVSASINYGF